MMTITFQTIGASRIGMVMSVLRQGLFYVPFILTLPVCLGATGPYLAQPATDVLTLAASVTLIPAMKRIALRSLGSGDAS